jgi:flagellar motor switch protein FliM
MSKILSQEEIDALLTSAAEIERSARPQAEAPPSAAAGRDDSVVLYNVRRPDRVSKDQIRSLHFLHDRFARNVATAMSAYLRSVTDVSILSVEQFTYAEFLTSLPDPTAFYALAIQPIDALCALEMNPNVAFTMIDRMLGGQGRGPAPTRALTEIEQNVIDAIVKLICDNLTETWHQIIDVQFKISGRETRPQMLQVSAPNEIVVMLGFDVRIGEARGMLNVCVPASVIESAGASFTQTGHRTRREPTASDRRHLRDSLSRVKLRVTANLDTTLPARELLVLAPGEVVSLGHLLRDPLEIRVQDSSKFTGRLIVREGQAAVRVEASTVPVPSEA